MKWQVLGMGVLLVSVLAGCAGAANPDLVATVSGLETQVANQEEWIGYQATQIGHDREVLSYLATRIPPSTGSMDVPTTTPTPFQPVGFHGSVLIHGGGCCVGSTAGDVISVDVRFEAQSAGGEVVQMRILTTRSQVSPDQIEEAAWEAFAEEREFQVDVPGNWSSFWVYVQFRDSNGHLSPIYSDDIAVEGMPPEPTDTPVG